MMIIIGNSMYYNPKESTITMALTLLSHGMNKYSLTVERTTLACNPVTDWSLRNLKKFIFG